jgi:signal transduction histidine kinase
VLKVCREPTRLEDIVRRVRNEFKSALAERQISLTITGLDTLPTLLGDPELLTKVFFHLVMNAIKFTPDGGAVTITGQLLAGPPALIEIAVQDTGIGIAPEHQALIFEKFYQTGQVSFHSSGRTKFKGGGPGLGLAIAKGIAQAHGGHISVQSAGYDEEHCPGSTFYVRLPLE